MSRAPAPIGHTMSMSTRQRTKSVKKAQTLIPAGVVIDYAIGREGRHPTLVMGGVLGLFATLSLVMLAATGGFVMPGLLLLLVMQHLISPPRGIAVCDRGVAVTERSLWNGEPTKVVALAEFAHVWPARHQLCRTEVAVGHLKVWLNNKEEERLRTALGAAQAGVLVGTR